MESVVVFVDMIDMIWRVFFVGWKIRNANCLV